MAVERRGRRRNGSQKPAIFGLDANNNNNHDAGIAKIETRAGRTRRKHETSYLLARITQLLLLLLWTRVSNLLLSHALPLLPLIVCCLRLCDFCAAHAAAFPTNRTDRLTNKPTGGRTDGQTN